MAALLAPFTPFLAEEIYANLAGGESGDFGELPDSVHLRDFPEPDDSVADLQLERRWRRSGAPWSSAERRAPSRGSRRGSRCVVRLSSPAGPSGRRSRERTDLVTTELNVKELEFVSEESELVSYRVKPNYRTLGPRFGKDMPKVAAAIEALDAAGVARSWRTAARSGFHLNGRDHSLGADDVNLVMEPLDGYQVEAAAGHAVALALEIDDELRREGLAREIVHAVQNARRDAGLEVTDRIALGLGGDAELLDAARAHEAYLAGETLATAITYDGAGEGARAEIDGRELLVAIERSSQTGA